MDDIKLAQLGDKEAAKRLTDAGVLLMQGDCLELLKDIPDGSVDMVLCDLPYGTTYYVEWDKPLPLDPLWAQYKRICKENAPIVLFGKEPFSSTLRLSNRKMFRYDWVWEKTVAPDFGMAKSRPRLKHEMISVFYRKQPVYNPQMEQGKPYRRNSGRRTGLTCMRPGGSLETHAAIENPGTRYPSSIQKFNNGNNGSLHPTQKPVPLLEYLIRTYTNPGMTVLDNCMGSGSTGVACVNTGRKFIGMELDPGYFEVAKRRIEEAQAQARLAWNTRAPILSESELKKLEENT